MNKLRSNRVVSLVLAIMMIISFTSIATFATSDGQVQYFDFKNEQFQAPPATKFNRFYNRLLKRHNPHHFGTDAAFTTNDAQRIEGFFAYGDIRVPLAKEYVSIYEYSLEGNGSWNFLGRAKTGYDGKINFQIPNSKKLSEGFHLIKLYVEGDGTQANCYIQVLNSSKPYVVFDIDGTLTTRDFENAKKFMLDFVDSIYVEEMYTDANKVVEHYAAKGYGIVYLSSRPEMLGEESQNWLISKNMPRGFVHVNSSRVPLTGPAAANYKYNFLNLLKSKGINICYAYGNATTDVEAYQRLGIPNNNINIIGENAGYNGTNAISSYTEHLATLS